eukprot:m.578610 g.578610  ORF g.578610 m.578610 type:complete len:54 (-) comp22308_c0_seq8:2401-2562(-)
MLIVTQVTYRHPAVPEELPSLSQQQTSPHVYFSTVLLPSNSRAPPNQVNLVLD